MSSLNQRESAELNKKPTTENIHKVLFEVTKTNPLPIIKKGIDTYINERKMKKKKKFLQIEQTQSLPNKSDYDMKRYEDIYQSIAQFYKKPDLKKRILMSPNKVVPHQKIMEVFEPYKKEIEKLRLKKHFSNQDIQDTPFGHALRELGIFSEFESQNKNKMIPLKPTGNAYRSLPKKQFKEKLKPISDSNIKIGGAYDNRFLSVEKINLIDSDMKMKQTPTFSSVNQSKGVEVFVSEQKKEIEVNFKKMQEVKKEREFRMNPQIYIKKMYNAKNIELERDMQEVLAMKKTEKSVSSIMKFYPSLNNNLKNKPIKTNGNLAIFSYTKQLQSLDVTRNGVGSQSQSVRLMNATESIGNYAIGEDDDMTEGFYNSEGTPMKGQGETIIEEEEKMQSNTKQSTNGGNSPMKIYRRKKFFSSLPFETYYYRDLIWKVNFSNDMFVETPIEYEHRLKAFIGKGNNSSMIFGLIKRRIWFAVTDKVEEANFVWTQLKILSYFKKQDSGKGISISTQENGLQVDYLKNGNILNSRDSNQFKNYFETYINFEEKSDERFLNRQKCFKYQKSIKASEIRDQKLQNHLINNYVIGNKKALFNTMSNYYTSIGQDVFDFLPLTFHIKNGLEDESWYKFLKYYYKRSKDIKKANEDQANKNAKEYNSWIVKPGENSNRGNGIQVCLTLEEIKNIIKKKDKYSDGSPKTYIVQSYIEKPLLYQKRKFDIRHYMMLTCINGKVKGYFYKDGYVRTTSSEYNLKTNCGKIHLTNDAVQKNLPDYGKYEKGNKISYEQLCNYMSKQPKHKGFDFYGKIYPRMKKIATDVMKACSGGIDPQKLINNFEVFGMDFMIDSNYNVWLIEVNSNPCLELSCPLLGSIIPKMVENALELTMDCMFPPPVRYNPKGVHYYKNLEQENRFELVYDERIDGLSTSSMDVLDGKMLYEEDDIFEDDGEQWTED